MCVINVMNTLPKFFLQKFSEKILQLFRSTEQESKVLNYSFVFLEKKMSKKAFIVCHLSDLCSFSCINSAHLDVFRRSNAV